MKFFGVTDRSLRSASDPGPGSSTWWYMRIGTRTLRSTPSGVGSHGVAVGVCVEVWVAVGVCVGVWVAVGVCVRVEVAVGVVVGVEVLVGVAVGLGVEVAVIVGEVVAVQVGEVAAAKDPAGVASGIDGAASGRPDPSNCPTSMATTTSSATNSTGANRNEALQSDLDSCCISFSVPPFLGQR